MYAIEFQATINNGIIEVPKHYQQLLQKHAKVIVLMEEKSKESGILTRLLQTPMKLKHFTPLTREEIYER